MSGFASHFLALGCELDLCLCKNLSELCREIVCWSHVDLHFFVKNISDALCYVVKEINRWSWLGLVCYKQ